MQPVFRALHKAQLLIFVVSSQRKIIILPLIISVSLLLLTGFLGAILEEINIPAIQDMTLREEQGHQFLDALVTIRNTSQKTLKLVDCDFHLAIVSQQKGDIELGGATVSEVLLEQEGETEKTDTDVLLSIDLGTEREVNNLYQELTSTAEFLVLDEKPQLNLHLQAHFNLALKSSQAWHYSNGITLDWIITPEVERAVLIKFLQAISGGEFAAPTPVPATPPPDEASTPAP